MFTVDVDDACDLEESDDEERVAGAVDVHDVEEVEAALRYHGQAQQEEGRAEEATAHHGSSAHPQGRKLVDEGRHDALGCRELPAANTALKHGYCCGILRHSSTFFDILLDSARFCLMLQQSATLSHIVRYILRDSAPLCPTLPSLPAS